MQAVLTRFDAAWSQRNEREMASVESRLRELLHTELAESRAELDVTRPRSAATTARCAATAGNWAGMSCGASPGPSRMTAAT